MLLQVNILKRVTIVIIAAILVIVVIIIIIVITTIIFPYVVVPLRIHGTFIIIFIVTNIKTIL